MCWPMVCAVGLGDRRDVVDRAARHHGDAVGELEDLVEVLRHQQHGGAAVALLHDLRADLGDRGEVEPEAGVGDDQHVDVAGELARQHGALHVAAREGRDRRSRARAS